jgi:hypothetical protein
LSWNVFTIQWFKSYWNWLPNNRRLFWIIPHFKANFFLFVACTAIKL